MIISWLTGGLGNQMFQYAAGLALAEHLRTVHKLDVTWFKLDPAYESHNRYALSCWNVTEQFATDEELQRVQGVRLSKSEQAFLSVARLLRMRRLARLLENTGQRLVQSDHDFVDSFWNAPDHTYLQGMFQSEKYFSPVANLLRAHFTPRYPLHHCTIEWMERVRSGPSIALHFRRGDYAKDPRFAKAMGVLDLDYHHRALARLRERSPAATVYVFSDDIAAVEAEFSIDGPHHFVRGIPPELVHEKILLMSQCEQIAIANSTFSWWAAWLNPNPDKLVIAPDPWFLDAPARSANLVPESWIRLAR
jgi:hypothetical protein